MSLETRPLTQLLTVEQAALAAPLCVEVICLPFGQCLAFLLFRIRTLFACAAARWQLDQKRLEALQARRRASRVCMKG